MIGDGLSSNQGTLFYGFEAVCQTVMLTEFFSNRPKKSPSLNKKQPLENLRLILGQNNERAIFMELWNYPVFVPPPFARSHPGRATELLKNFFRRSFPDIDDRGQLGGSVVATQP